MAPSRVLDGLEPAACGPWVTRLRPRRPRAASGPEQLQHAGRRRRWAHRDGARQCLQRVAPVVIAAGRCATRYICLAYRHAVPLRGSPSAGRGRPGAAGWPAPGSSPASAPTRRSTAPREATRPSPLDLAPGLAAALRDRGIERLYAHQAQAVASGRGRRRGTLVVATPDGQRQEPLLPPAGPAGLRATIPTRARIYLYPDQGARARSGGGAARADDGARACGTGAVVYDGDTPADARRAARERAGIVLTNPDMLHTGILPHHTSWARTLAASPLRGRRRAAHLPRRLRLARGQRAAAPAARGARSTGRDPQLIGATATIGNPREHAARLFGVPRGRGRARRRERRAARAAPVLPLQPAGRQRRARHPRELREAGGDARGRSRARAGADHRVRPVAKHGRGHAPLPARRRGHARDRTDQAPDRSHAHHGLPRRLPAGAAARHRAAPARRARSSASWPPTRSSSGSTSASSTRSSAPATRARSRRTWQRFGRAGRRGEQSIGVLVAVERAARSVPRARAARTSSARRSRRRASIPTTSEILVQHLKCAAFELPFKRGEAFGSLGAEETERGARVPRAPPRAARVGRHVPLGGRRLPGQRRVAPQRGLGQRRHHRRRARQVHRRARLARGAHDAARAGHLPARRRVLAGRALRPREPQGLRAQGRARLLDRRDDLRAGVGHRGERAPERRRWRAATWPSGWGEVAVVEKVVGYKKIKFYTHENAGYGDVRLPEMQMHTTAFWLTVPERVVRAHRRRDAPRPSTRCAASASRWRRWRRSR